MEGIGADLEVMKRVPLAAGHIDAIRAIGRERSYGAGDIMARIGDPMDRFLYVVAGEIEVVDPYSEKRMGDATLGPGLFVGELSFLSGGTYFLAMRAVIPTVTIEVAREAMLDLMARVPELSDHIITVFAARRQQLVERRSSSIKVIGSDLDPMPSSSVAGTPPAKLRNGGLGRDAVTRTLYQPSDAVRFRALNSLSPV